MMTLEQKLRRYFGKRLRQIFSRSPIKAFVYKSAKTKSGYMCHYCTKWFKNRADLDLEHFYPVVDPTAAYISSFDYFCNLFSFNPRTGNLDVSNLLLSCKPCHKKKTKEETETRRLFKTGRFSEESKARAALTRARNKKRKSKK